VSLPPRSASRIRLPGLSGVDSHSRTGNSAGTRPRDGHGYRTAFQLRRLTRTGSRGAYRNMQVSL